MNTTNPPYHNECYEKESDDEDTPYYDSDVSEERKAACWGCQLPKCSARSDEHEIPKEVCTELQLLQQLFSRKSLNLTFGALWFVVLCMVLAGLQAMIGIRLYGGVPFLPQRAFFLFLFIPFLIQREYTTRLQRG